MPNRLQHESSPYLLQHAHNPVDWFPWGEEAFEKAIAEDKPVLVSIGYSACHWCHVMERESFESEETAALMNEQFVNIKIDREERPDLDHIYMDAVQAMTGSGGWPLNVFLTPEKKPFYGGTYFPPTPVFNRPSWTDVLSGIATNFREKREEVEQQATYLTAHIDKSNDFGIGSGAGVSKGAAVFNKDQAQLMFNNIMKTADRQEGGFGQAPKFPQTFTIRFLLHYYYHTKDVAALDQAMLSLEKMIDGGINDHLGGGFARYSTDASWLAPHFEKMLYDNALLVTAMSEAYQITQSPKLLSAITKTIDFVSRELTDSNHGMYAALDADSEGVEGKFYTWSRSEIEIILGEDTDLFCEYYGVTVAGNWEHTNILHLPPREISLATAYNMDAADLELFIGNCRDKLLKRREGRVRPQLDDKIILGWNALMVIALCKASAATGNMEWRSRAVANMKFLLSSFRQPDGSYAHTFKNNISKYPAFLDDYAYLISALIHLQEVTADPEWLNIAKSLTNFVCTKFGDNGPLFHFTAVDQKDVIIRKKEIYDGAVPSGNAVMMWNLYQLGIIFDIAAWRSRASEMAGTTAEAAVKFPGSFGIWAGFMLSMAYGIPEIAITGEESTDLSNEFLRNFIGYNVFQSATLSNEEFPLLAGKPIGRKAMLFLCQNYACQAPVETVADLLELLNET